MKLKTSIFLLNIYMKIHTNLLLLIVFPVKDNYFSKMRNLCKGVHVQWILASDHVPLVLSSNSYLNNSTTTDCKTVVVEL
ncbi:MAG: hypothetical protein ACI8PB_002370 [Desulforhopalus sp.]|jgi:hypothetical protein